MLKNYTVKYKNIVVGTIDLINFVFKPDNHCNPLFIPRELRTARTKKDVLEFLESRIVQKDNQGIKKIINDLGLKTYNPISIIDKTKGMDLNDCIWVTSDPNEDYYKVHIRENTDRYVKRICL